jgi:hypothetical protein
VSLLAKARELRLVPPSATLCRVPKGRWLPLPGLSPAIPTILVLSAGWWLRVEERAAAWVPLAALTTLLIVAIHAAYARRAGPARAAMLGLAVIAPLALGAHGALREWVFGGQRNVAMSGLMAAPSYLLALGLLALMLRTAWWARSPWALRLSLVVSTVAVGACAVFAGVGLLKRTTHDDPDSWRARTVKLGCFTSPRDIEYPAPYPPSTACDGPLDGTGAAICQGSMRVALKLGREGQCRIDVRDEAGHEGTLTYEESRYHTSMWSPPCVSRCMYRIEGVMWIASLGSYLYDDPRAFRDPLLHEIRQPTVVSFAAELAPPRRWSLAALLGVALALVIMVAPRDRALRERLSWREDVLDGEAVLVSPRVGPDTYRYTRSLADPSLVVRGALATTRQELLRGRAARWAFAAMVALVLATPLLVAAGCGFLHG